MIVGPLELISLRIVEPAVIDEYISKLRSCTSLQTFGVEFYLSPDNFQMNSIGWQVAARFLAYVPLTAIDAISLNFFPGLDGELSDPALGQLDWVPMRDVLNRFLNPREPSVTIFSNIGFDDVQIEYILCQLPELAESEVLYINGCDDLPRTGIYDEVAVKMLDYESDSDAMLASEDESDAAMDEA